MFGKIKKSLLLLSMLLVSSSSGFAFNVTCEDTYDKFFGLRRGLKADYENQFIHLRSGMKLYKLKFWTLNVGFDIPRMNETGMYYGLDLKLGNSPLSYYTINVNTTNGYEPDFDQEANAYNAISINAFNFGGLSIKCDHRVLAMEGNQEYYAPDGYGGVYRAKRYNTFTYEESRIGLELQMPFFLNNYVGIYYSHKTVQGYDVGRHIWEETRYNVSESKNMMGLCLGTGIVLPFSRFFHNYHNLDFTADYDGFICSYETGIAIPLSKYFNLKVDYAWFMKTLEDEYTTGFRYADLDNGKTFGISAAIWI